MARSEKTLNIDTIMVETLYNRGVPLSTSQTYIATVSPLGPYVPPVAVSYTYTTTTISGNDLITAVPNYLETYSSRDCAPMTKPSQGQFLQWTNQPLSTIYDNYFYGVNPQDLIDQLALIQKEGEFNMNAYTIASNTIINMSETTIEAYSNIAYANSSTINSYNSTLLYYNSSSILAFEYLSTILNNASTIISELSTNFYTTLFLPYETTLIERGNYYYLQRPPLPTPVPWYWQGFPSRYIGPGLSSMYISTVLNEPLVGSYVDLLSTTSTSCGWLNSTSIGNLSSFVNLTYTVYNVVDTGSSISTAYGDSSSTFQGHLQTEFYGTDVSTISSFVSDYFTQYSILTDGPSISTGASSMFQMLSDLNSTTLGHISSGILGDPISTFSTIAYTQLLSVQTVFITAQDYSTFSSLYGIFSTTIVSTATLVSPSTNVAGYQTMSTLAQTTFSTFSTIFPIVLGYDILTTTSTLNSQLAVFSSILVPQNSTIYGLNSAYMAAAGVSSLNSNLSTYTQDYYLSASAQISTLSTVLQYSTLIYQSTLDTAAEFYSSITVITDYSTFAVIDFTSVETVSINDISSVSVSTVASQNGMIVQGPVYQLSSSVEAALSMSNIAIYATDSDVPYILGTKQIQAKVSSILFNSTFTIHTPSVGLTQASERLSTLVGINTTTPAYALDIGSGDARKPTGTQWINPSDERIKMAIGDADIDTVIKQISTLRLVSYTWSETYRQAHGLARGTMLGFLSQEVEAVFPGSVSSAPEEGFADFKSLNTDQIAKAKFALTCHLLSKVGKLQAKLNNLREV